MGHTYEPSRTKRTTKGNERTYDSLPKEILLRTAAQQDQIATDKPLVQSLLSQVEQCILKV